MYVHVLSSHARMVYIYPVRNNERSWPGFENEGRVGEREMTEEHAVSSPGCISKHQELVRQVSEGQSTMINTLHKTLSSSILSFTGLLKLDPSPWSSLVPDLSNFCSCTKSKPHPRDAHRSSGLVLQIHHIGKV